MTKTSRTIAVATIATLSSAIAGPPTITTINQIDVADSQNLESWSDPQDQNVVLQLGTANEFIDLFQVGPNEVFVVTHVRISDGSGADTGLYESPVGAGADVRKLGGNFVIEAQPSGTGAISLERTGVVFNSNTNVRLKIESSGTFATSALTVKGYRAPITPTLNGAQLLTKYVEEPIALNFFSYVQANPGVDNVSPGTNALITTLPAGQMLCITYVSNLNETVNDLQILHKLDGGAQTETQLVGGDLLKTSNGPINLTNETAICSPGGSRIVMKSITATVDKNKVLIMGFITNAASI